MTNSKPQGSALKVKMLSMDKFLQAYVILFVAVFGSIVGSFGFKNVQDKFRKIALRTFDELMHFS
jgi:hypothetical protein